MFLKCLLLSPDTVQKRLQPRKDGLCALRAGTGVQVSPHDYSVLIELSTQDERFAVNRRL